MKQKRYWLRGGIILGSIVCFLSIVSIIPYSPFFIINIILSMPHWWIVKLTGYCTGGESCIGTWLIIFSFLYVIEGFVLGSLLGWLYGKIKNRN